MGTLSSLAKRFHLQLAWLQSRMLTQCFNLLLCLIWASFLIFYWSLHWLESLQDMVDSFLVQSNQSNFILSQLDQLNQGIFFPHSIQLDRGFPTLSIQVTLIFKMEDEETQLGCLHLGTNLMSLTFTPCAKVQYETFLPWQVVVFFFSTAAAFPRSFS